LKEFAPLYVGFPVMFI